MAEEKRRSREERAKGRYGTKDTSKPREERDHPDTPAAEKSSEGGSGDISIRDAGNGNMSKSEDIEPDDAGGMDERHASERKMMASRQEGERRDMHNTHREEHRAMEKRHEAEHVEARNG